MLHKSPVLRMPAEWERQDAVWLAMPHNRAEWGAFFEQASATLTALVELLERAGDRVELMVKESFSGESLLRGVSSLTSLELTQSLLTFGRRREHGFAYGDIWLRDTGAVFLHSESGLVAAGFRFNGWGGKYCFPGDTEVAQLMARAAKVSLVPHEITLEGGAIDCNGAGTFLTTRQCLLNTNRNPTLSEADVTLALEKALGARKIIWLEQGLAGDHTDGHVDNIARFVARDRVVCTASDSGDPNANVHAEVRQALSSATTADGEPLQVTPLPSPGSVIGPEGPMAASYCNFLITNHCVIVPTFDRPSDAQALAVLAVLFPQRQVVGLPCFALLTGGGTVHCISQQQPAPLIL